MQSTSQLERGPGARAEHGTGEGVGMRNEEHGIPAGGQGNLGGQLGLAGEAELWCEGDRTEAPRGPSP